MSKRSKIQMGVNKKKRQKERREGIKKNLRDEVHISKRDTGLRISIFYSCAQNLLD